MDDVATEQEIGRARDLYDSDDIDIDDGAAASRGEGGLWVAAWVWLSDEEEV